MEARKKYNPGMTQDDIDSSNQPQEFKLTGKVKVRYAETKMVKDMRENFEKREKIAQRSSKTYRLVVYFVVWQSINAFAFCLFHFCIKTFLYNF